MIPSTCRRTILSRPIASSSTNIAHVAWNSTSAAPETLPVPPLHNGNRIASQASSPDSIEGILKMYLHQGEPEYPMVRPPSRHVGHHKKPSGENMRPRDTYPRRLRAPTPLAPVKSFVEKDKEQQRQDLSILKKIVGTQDVEHPPSATSSWESVLEGSLDKHGPQRESAPAASKANWVSEKWVDELKPTPQHSFERNLGKKKKTKGKVKGESRDPPPHGIPLKEVEGLLASEGEEVLEDVEPTTPGTPIAQLAHGLDRVLFNPGVHWVQDPRSRVYNFTPFLETVPKVSEFDYDRLPTFVPSSRDNELRTLAQREGKRFAGSTSSLSGILSQCYFLIGETKEVDTSRLSMAFRNEPRTFSPGQRWPASVILNYEDGVYTIDSDKSKIDVPEKTILTWLGTLLEKFLTTRPEEFKKYLKSTPPSPELEETKYAREAYRYSKSDDFVMRSQLDCHDPRLPGTGVFDIKTRACVATRLDILNYEEHTGYTIRQQHGIVESFEKEYYDLIRSAFLKYSFQVRIGNMDGVIVAYHNTGRMFGFQYIPLADMDACLYGSSEEGVGDRVFEKCVGLMEKVMNEVVDCFGAQSVKATFETKENTKGMHVWIEPLHWDGPDEDRPIEQLRVEVTSYSGADPVKGLQAAIAVDADWTLRYKICRLDILPETKRQNLASARARQNPAFLIPSHVAEHELEDYWNSLCHSGKPGDMAEVKEFDPSMFIPPPHRIQVLRQLSRKGKEDMEAYEDEPKVVWEATGHAGSA